MTPTLGPARLPLPESLTRYLVELSDTGGALASVQALADRARRAAAEVSQEGTRVRFLRVVFVPEDGSCFLLYEGESEQAVNRAVASGEIGVRRVAHALQPADVPVDDDAGGPSPSVEVDLGPTRA